MQAVDVSGPTALLEITEVIEEYQAVFQELEGMPPTNRPKHDITLEDGVRLVLKNPCWLLEPQWAALQTQISELLRKGWIRPSVLLWGSLVLLVPKKDGSLRLCVDYYDVNAMTVRDGTPLPRIDVILEKLGRSQWFSKLDFNSGFHQISMEVTVIDTTAF